ncbi:L,D-transpeptidase family protein [Parenemella sanctibonifatiensis]|nr:L,D-transpeptidase family protein [Parenemella sanctibonifatiensis]
MTIRMTALPGLLLAAAVALSTACAPGPDATPAPGGPGSQETPAVTPTETPGETPATTPSDAPTNEPTESPEPSTPAPDSPTETPTPDPIPEPGPAILEEGDNGPKVRELQARLRQIDWFSGNVADHYGSKTAAAVKGFQTKRGYAPTGAVDQRTWDRIVSMTTKPTSDELNNTLPTPKPGRDASNLDERCLTGRVLCIDKSKNTLTWVIDGEVQDTLEVRFGTEKTPTREGSFQVERKSRNHVSNLYGSKMPFAMFFSGGQAVHYSSDFAKRGYNGGSHGCVNVRDWDGIEALYAQVQVGDKVIVHD